MIQLLSDKLHAETTSNTKLKEELRQATTRVTRHESSARNAEAACVSHKQALRNLGSANARLESTVARLEGRLRQGVTQIQILDRKAKEANAKHQQVLQDLAAECDAHDQTRTLLTQARQFIAYTVRSFAIPLRVDIKRVLGQVQTRSA